jgi:hypothetical protein
MHATWTAPYILLDFIALMAWHELQFFWRITGFVGEWEEKLGRLTFIICF